MQATIRPATSEDAPALTALLHQLYAEEGYETSLQPEQLAAQLAGEGEVVLRALVAEENGTMLAVVFFYAGYDLLSASSGYHLADIIVQPAIRQQGIGRQLMQALAARTLDEGKEWVSLTVLKQNIPAHAFYTKLGMTQVEVNFFAIGARGLQAVGVISCQ